MAAAAAVRRSRSQSCPKVDHVKAERNLLAEVSNPSIVKLYYSFQDDEFLYLVCPRAPTLARPVDASRPITVPPPTR